MDHVTVHIEEREHRQSDACIRDASVHTQRVEASQWEAKPKQRKPDGAIPQREADEVGERQRKAVSLE